MQRRCRWWKMGCWCAVCVLTQISWKSQSELIRAHKKMKMVVATTQTAGDVQFAVWWLCWCCDYEQLIVLPLTFSGEDMPGSWGRQCCAMVNRRIPHVALWEFAFWGFISQIMLLLQSYLASWARSHHHAPDPRLQLRISRDVTFAQLATYHTSISMFEGREAGG